MQKSYTRSFLINQGEKMIKWAEEELKGLDLKDARLNARCIKLLDTLGANPQASIPGAIGKSWSETIAAYRLLSHEKVTCEKVMYPHTCSTKKRARGEKVVLALQDTTELDYSSHQAKEGIGPLNSEKHQGLLLHPTLLVTPEQVPLGLLDDYTWYRKQVGKKGSHKYEKIEDKESQRWLESYRKSQQLAEELSETQIINISDREGDIYEMFLEYQRNAGKKRSDYIIRACQNRCIVPSENQEEGIRKLWDLLRHSQEKGEIEFDTPAGRGKKSRKVVQSIRSMTLTLKPPQSRRAPINLESVQVRAVLAEEIQTPEGEEPVTWLLLTSLEVEDFKKSREVICYYLCRWMIERFFYVVKQGCKIEELHLQKEDSLGLCLRFYLIIAWRVLYLTMLGRQLPNLSCEAVFEEYEWKAIYVFVKQKPPPTQAPSLDEMIRLVASLGGFLNRKGDGFPGSKTVWIGLQRSIDITRAWIAFNKIKIENTYV
jgi:Transposase Tn5 dimerisation domain/Transposase DNA-binding